MISGATEKCTHTRGMLSTRPPASSSSLSFRTFSANLYVALVGLPYCMYGYGLPTTAYMCIARPVGELSPTAHRRTAYLMDSLERLPERALSEPRLWEVRFPQQVGVTEHQLDRMLLLVRALAIVEVGPADDAA